TAPAGLVASMTMRSGSVSTGAVVSTTSTTNAAEASLSAASEAVAVTIVRPSPKMLPDAKSTVTGTSPSTRSRADTVNVTIAPAGDVASVRMSSGTLTTGGVVSTTFTSNVAVP